MAAIAGASLLVFAASLALPALRLADGQAVPGWRLLVWGWFGLLTGDLPWFANLIYAVALACFVNRSWDLAWRLAAASALFGSLSMLVGDWWFDSADHRAVVGLGPAFYVWQAAFLLLAASAWAFTQGDVGSVMARREDGACNSAI